MEPKLSKPWSRLVSMLMIAFLWIVKWCALLLSLLVYFGLDPIYSQ